MRRELLILRHGKSDWRCGEQDFYRPLRNRGKRSAQRIGEWLWKMNLRPDLVVSSAAERAISTAHKCCKAMNLNVAEHIIEDARVYLAPLDTLLEVLADASAGYGRIMLVGHNPGLEDLLKFLAENQFVRPADGKLLPTATLALLSMPDKWKDLKAGCADLKSIVRPRELPEAFHFPDPAGDEIRDRPAYYYTQSAVIPYRMNDDGKPVFLVIGSSKKRHWVVPKGIQEPGLTPQQSAAREAWEEAGVRGVVGDQGIGQYYVEKWGAECSVDVFPMRVTEIVGEEQWEEKHRCRRWLSAESAADCLKQPELGEMVRLLAGDLET